MERLLTIAAPASLLVLCTACDERIHILNVAPTVTAVGPVSVEDDTATIIYWLRDHEEDAADIQIEMVVDGKAVPLALFGGHGDVGLTTSRDGIGKAHPVQFKVGDLDTSTEITLRVQAIDDHGEISPTFETAAFKLQDGLPAP